MYKLLIVDDEYWIRKRLMSTIDWASLGICQVFEAEDGKEALGICVENEPDIIVTDINMPELSGIDLMKALNESALYPRIILISGYNEFEYARSALKLGAVDYLLKPVEENELIRIIKSCIENFEEEKKMTELHNAVIGSSTEIRTKLLWDLLLGKIGYTDNSLLRLSHIGIDFPYSAAACLIAHSDQPMNPDRKDYMEETLISFSIPSVMKEVLPAYFQHFFIVKTGDLNVAVLFWNKDSEELHKAIKTAVEGMKELSNKLSNTGVSFGIGVEVSNIFDLNKSYKTAIYAINFSNYNDWASILSFGEGDKTEWLDLQNVYSDYNLEAIAIDIKKNDRTSAFANLELLMNDFLDCNSKNPTPLQIKLFYTNVLNTLFRSCLTACPPSEEFLDICTESLENTGMIYSVEKLMSNLRKVVDFLLSQYSTFMGNKRHWLIDKITAYVKENFASPLTLNSVASMFYLNPSYFCKLFKDETGLTFTHYLMRLRIEKSKELMLETNMKFYDIAARVGYSNVQYFCTIFKEIEGITPSQYRSTH